MYLLLIGAGFARENHAPVVLQLLDRIFNIAHRAVIAGLLWRIEIGGGVPTACDLLNGGDIDDSVMEEGIEEWHIAGDEVSVGRDGVASEWGFAGFYSDRFQVGDNFRFGIGEGGSARYKR